MYCSFIKKKPVTILLVKSVSFPQHCFSLEVPKVAEMKDLLKGSGDPYICT